MVSVKYLVAGAIAAVAYALPAAEAEALAHNNQDHNNHHNNNNQQDHNNHNNNRQQDHNNHHNENNQQDHNNHHNNQKNNNNNRNNNKNNQNGQYYKVCGEAMTAYNKCKRNSAKPDQNCLCKNNSDFRKRFDECKKAPAVVWNDFAQKLAPGMAQCGLRK